MSSPKSDKSSANPISGVSARKTKLRSFRARTVLGVEGRRSKSSGIRKYAIARLSLERLPKRQLTLLKARAGIPIFTALSKMPAVTVIMLWDLFTKPRDTISAQPFSEIDSLEIEASHGTNPPPSKTGRQPRKRPTTDKPTPKEDETIKPNPAKDGATDRTGAEK